MKTYTLDKENNLLIINTKLYNFRDGIKVYFYRNIDETKSSDLPVCCADTNSNKNVFEWIEGFEILGVQVKKPHFIFWWKWEVLENDNIKSLTE